MNQGAKRFIQLIEGIQEASSDSRLKDAAKVLSLAARSLESEKKFDQAKKVQQMVRTLQGMRG